MKVLMLNTFDTLGGAARAARRLQKGLQTLEVDARLLVQFKFGDSVEVICTTSPLVKMLRRLKIFLGLLPVRFYSRRAENNFSPALLPDNILKAVANCDPDIIHLHWLGAGFFQVETLHKLSQLGKPMVWTLHDSWPFTGGCHVPFECTRYLQRCGACPVLGSTKEADLSRWTWKRKEKSWHDLSLNLVAPSRWLAGCARNSSLFHNGAVEVIPNGLDTEIFHPRDQRDSRKLSGLPEARKLILFGAMHGTNDPNKGFHLLAPALQSLSKTRPDTLAVVFGSDTAEGLPDLGMPVKNLGRIDDDQALAALYAAADVFVVPSLQETFCQTATEALACGTPVVAFAATGLLDLVEHRNTGYLAEPYAVEDLAAGLVWVLEDDERRAELSTCARQKAVAEFGLARMAERYAALYRGLLENRNNPCSNRETSLIK